MSVNTVYSVSECVLQNIFMIYKMIMFKTSPKSDITNRSASAQLCSVTPASWLAGSAQLCSVTIVTRSKPR